MKRAEGHISATKHFSAFSINIIFFLLSLTGLVLIPRLTIKLNPGTQANTLNINYRWPNALPATVEQEVTSKLEGAFSTLRGIEHVISESSAGAGYIILELKKGIKLQTIRFEALSIIKDLWQHMPEGVSYPEISAGDEKKQNLLVSYVLKGDAGTFELQQYAQNVLQPELAAVDGINNVEVYGALPYEWQFHYDEKVLGNYGIKPADIFRALNHAGEMRGVGHAIFDTAFSAQLPVMVISPGLDDQDNSWARIPVTYGHGRIIRLGDISTRLVAQQKPRSYFRINGLNTININTYSDETANQLKVSGYLQHTVESLIAGMPESMSLEKMYDSSEYLRNELRKTMHRAVAAILILLIFVLISLRNLRYLFVLAVCLVSNLLIAVILYNLLKVEIHLVSIAGITVSLSIIIDNFIMMSNYIVQGRSIRGFTAILGSTLTTLGALVVIFFLGEQERDTLIDFAMVVIINLIVSLTIALFFIPALINRLQLRKPSLRAYRKRKLRVLWFNRMYAAYIRRAYKWRWAMAVVALFAFGLPFSLLPEKIKAESFPALAYNKILGSDFYRQKLRPYIEKWTGGTMRLFVQNSLHKFQGFREAQETVLYTYISLPKGTTTLQMNELCISLEKFLAGQEGIRQYQTSIRGPQWATIVVYFTTEAQQSTLPNLAKTRMIEKAIEYNGADFNIFMRNDGFSNALSDSWRNWQILLSGYNYRELLSLAHTTRDSLALNPRIQSLAIFSGDAGRRQLATEEQINIDIDKAQLVARNRSFQGLTGELSKLSAVPMQAGTIAVGGIQVPVRLISTRSLQGDKWQLLNMPVFTDSIMLKLASSADFSTIHTDGSIFKKDQSYMVTVAFDYIGPEELAKRVLRREISSLNLQLPLGYKAEVPGYDYSWLFGNKQISFWIIALVVAVIWAICAVIFESLRQPFVVISTIPLSYIGVFITFWYFDIPFDQGGYAALILLGGIVVNMSIYIFNDINHLRKTTTLLPVDIYVKAFSIKIIPLLLSAAATVLALSPFIVFDKNGVFWYALACGTIGGLVFSIPVLVFYLPLMINFKPIKKND